MSHQKTDIPVSIITGFLGSGKTSLINHVLKNSGQNIAVIVNDFGDINIDAMLVAQQTDEKIELSNGCICCSMGESGLDDTIEQLLKQNKNIDAIIIEASGIAEPFEVKKMLLMSKVKNITYGGLLYVVDAVHFEKTRKQHSSLEAHIKTADCIVLNKIDELQKSVQQKCITEIRNLNKNAPIVKTNYGAIDPEFLFNAESGLDKSQQLSLAHAQEDHSQHLHSQFTSYTFSTKEPLSPKKFLTFIKNSLPGIFRIKGFVYFGMKGLEQKLVVQKVGKRVQLYTESWEESEEALTKLVFIGIDIKEGELKKQLDSCIDKTPDDIAPGEMLDVRSYVKD